MKTPALPLASAILLAALAPAQAQAATLNPTLVFLHAAPAMKAVMVILIFAMIAAIVICVRKLMAGPNLSGGSTFLSALRLGGPLLGLLGGAYNGLMMFMGLARGPQPFHVVAPGLAESALLVLLGLLCGVVAVACHWAVEARIDRTVLSR
jgi:biopolymer transport protein ExbB/TolQ